MTEIRLSEARDTFSRELTFPVSCEEVIAATGEVRLQSPSGDAETIAEVLGRCEEREFGSMDELFNTLMMHVAEEYVGRIGYDDRGETPGHDDEVSL